MLRVRSSRRPTWRFALGVLGGIVLSQLALGVAIDRRLSSARDPEGEAKLAQLHARRAETPGRPLVVVLGSSRVAYGVDAGRLSREGYPGALVYNFGILGSGPLLNLVNLRRLLDAGIRPDLLYVEILPAQFADRDVLLEEKMLDVARLRFDEVLGLRRCYRDRLRLFGGWCQGRALPCRCHRAGLHCRLTGATLADAPFLPDSHGWRVQGPVTNEYRQQVSGLARRQYGPYCAASALAAEPVRALEDLLALCRREGIPVRLLLMPQARPFREMYSPQMRTAIAALLNGLRVRWGVAAVDARDWIEDTDFSDSHHLLVEGARCFTTRFGREALGPALQEILAVRLLSYSPERKKAVPQKVAQAAQAE